jgi:hypothetical protein
MQQHDYIMCMIEQLGVALARVRDMITGRASRDDIQAELEAAARQGGVDFDMARIASVDTLVSLIAVGDEINPMQCWLTAELLLLDGMEAESRGGAADAAISYEKALRLLELLEPSGALSPAWPGAHERVGELQARLRGVQG